MRISEVIGQDYQYLDECYEKLKVASTTVDKIKCGNMLTWNVARHAISEEVTIYPAMEKYLGEEGKALTKVDFEQHSTDKKDLYTLQYLNPEDPKLLPLLEQLMFILHKHIEHEAVEDMPRLEKFSLKCNQRSVPWNLLGKKQFVLQTFGQSDKVQLVYMPKQSENSE